MSTTSVLFDFDLFATTDRDLDDARRVVAELQSWMPELATVTNGGQQLLVDDGTGGTYTLAESSFGDEAMEGGTPFLQTMLDALQLFPRLVARLDPESTDL